MENEVDYIMAVDRKYLSGFKFFTGESLSFSHSWFSYVLNKTFFTYKMSYEVFQGSAPIYVCLMFKCGDKVLTYLDFYGKNTAGFCNPVTLEDMTEDMNMYGKNSEDIIMDAITLQVLKTRDSSVSDMVFVNGVENFMMMESSLVSPFGYYLSSSGILKLVYVMELPEDVFTKLQVCEAYKEHSKVMTVSDILMDAEFDRCSVEVLRYA